MLHSFAFDDKYKHEEGVLMECIDILMKYNKTQKKFIYTHLENTPVCHRSTQICQKKV